MGIPRFFRSSDAKKFNYTPLYWDPDKEDREHRIRAIKQEMGVDVEFAKKSSAITRGSFRQTPAKSRSRANKNSNRRLILIVSLLLVIAYLIFYR